MTVHHWYSDINNQLDAKITIYWRFQSAQHVSGDNFVHPQEHLAMFTAYGTVHRRCCRPATSSVHCTINCKHSQVLLRMGENIARNVLSWLKPSINCYSCIYLVVYIILYICLELNGMLNLLTPNDHYSGRTALLNSKRCILYIYSTHRGTEYFKHCIYSSFFSLQNAVCFIILTYFVPVLFTFYIQGELKFKK